MSKVGRGAVALLVILVLAAMWRTGVRAGERIARGAELPRDGRRGRRRVCGGRASPGATTGARLADG